MMADVPHRDLRPILVIDDTLDDFETVVEAAHRAGVSNRIDHAVDAEVAATLLAGAPINTYAFVLLDYNLPGVDGLSFLRSLRSDPLHGKLPVVVFTASVNPRDRISFHAAGANAYFVKQLKFDECLDTLGRIFDQYLVTGGSSSAREALAMRGRPS